MKAQPSLQQTGSLSPNSHAASARKSWGGMLSTAHLILVHSQFAALRPLPHAQGPGWSGFSRSPIAFTLLPNPSSASASFFFLSYAPFISCLFFFTTFASYSSVSLSISSPPS